MEDFLIALLTLTVGGSLTAGLLVLLRAIPNKLPKSFYYYAWLLVLLRMALPIPGLLTIHQEAPAARFEAPAVQEMPTLTAPSELPELPAFTPQAERPSIQETPSPAPRPQVDVWQILGAVWAMGFLFSLGRDLSGYFRFRNALKKTLRPPLSSDLAVFYSLAGKRRPRLCRSRAVDSPMLMGLLHPMLLLPDRDYASDTLDCIFRHELTHYRRGDILYKWFTMPVLALHWFNPLTVFMRRDIERCCELSCDERILRGMDRDQRRSYGQTLLVLAARSAPARTALSTSFSTEKKKLKERLVQIMNFSPKSKKTIIAAVVLLMAVALCGILLGPAREAEAPAPETTPVETIQFDNVTNENKEIVAKQVTVSTVDELLSAIHSDTVIILEPGTYDLTTADGYGERALGNYSWAECYDGFMLNISNVKNLTITGTDKETCEIVTRPRYAPVLRFAGCENIKLSDFTAGHTPDQGACTGAVVYLDDTSDVDISDCVLYGCGTYGVQAHAASYVNVWNCDIKECSSGAVHFMNSSYVEVEDCRIFDCGTADAPATDLFRFDATQNAVIQNCTVTDSCAWNLICTQRTRDIYFLGNQIDNCALETVFNLNDNGPKVMGCSFDFAKVKGEFFDFSNGPQWFLGGNMVLSPDGEGLDDVTLAAMEHKPSDFNLIEDLGSQDIVDTPVTEAPSEGGFLTHGFDSRNLVYEGGELTVDYSIGTTRELWDLGVGLMVLLDGRPQPYKTAEDGEYAYFHTFHSADEVGMIFTPVTGRAGDRLTLSVFQILAPDYFPDIITETQMPFAQTDNAMWNMASLEFKADAPAAQSPASLLTDSKITYAERNQQESYFLLDEYGYQELENSMTISSQVLASGQDVDWTMTAYVNHYPVASLDFSTKDGEIAQVDMTLDLSGVHGNSLLYLVVAPRNGIDPIKPGEMGISPTMYLKDAEAGRNPGIVEVSTVDEFLAAIAPNTAIVMKEGTYDLSTASDYGKGDTDYYTWRETTDGYALELHDLTNFNISGAGKGKTVITALPRYAYVLIFRNCEGMDLNCFTAGHTEKPGTCAGGVLYFDNCKNAVIANCGLYGCGTIGIGAMESSDMIIGETEIYDCSEAAMSLARCRNIQIDDCDIHDVPKTFWEVYACTNVTMDGETVEEKQ